MAQLITFLILWFLTGSVWASLGTMLIISMLATILVAIFDQPKGTLK